MKKYRRRTLVVFLLLPLVLTQAKPKPEFSLVMFWPNANKPTLKLTFGKFQQIGEYAGQKSFSSQVTLDNVSAKAIPRASFTIYLLGNDTARIGVGVLHAISLPSAQGWRLSLQFRSVCIA